MLANKRARKGSTALSTWDDAAFQRFDIEADSSDSDEDLQTGHNENVKTFLYHSRRVRKDLPTIEKYALSLPEGIVVDCVRQLTISVKKFWSQVRGELAVIYEIRKLFSKMQRCKVFTPVNRVLGLSREATGNMDASELIMDRFMAARAFRKVEYGVLSYIKKLLISEYSKTKIERYADSYVTEALISDKDIKEWVRETFKTNPYKVINKLFHDDRQNGEKNMRRVVSALNLKITGIRDASLIAFEQTSSMSFCARSHRIFRSQLVTENIFVFHGLCSSEIERLKRNNVCTANVSDHGAKRYGLHPIKKWPVLALRGSSVFTRVLPFLEPFQKIVDAKVLKIVLELYASRIEFLRPYAGVIVAHENSRYVDIVRWRSIFAKHMIYVDYFDAETIDHIRVLFHASLSVYVMTSTELPAQLCGLNLREIERTNWVEDLVMVTPFESVVASRLGVRQNLLTSLPSAGYFSQAAKFFPSSTQLEFNDFFRDLTFYTKSNHKAEHDGVVRGIALEIRNATHEFYRVNMDMATALVDERMLTSTDLIIVLLDKVKDVHPMGHSDNIVLCLFREDARVKDTSDVLWEEYRYIWNLLMKFYKARENYRTRIWAVGPLGKLFEPFAIDKCVSFYATAFVADVLDTLTSCDIIREDLLRLQGRSRGSKIDSANDYSFSYSPSIFGLVKEQKELHMVMDMSMKRLIHLDKEFDTKFFTDFPGEEFFTDFSDESFALSPLEWTLTMLLRKGPSNVKGVHIAANLAQRITEIALAYHTSSLAIAAGLPTCMSALLSSVRDGEELLVQMSKRLVQQSVSLDRKEDVWARRKMIHPVEFLENLSKFVNETPSGAPCLQAEARFPRTCKLTPEHIRFIIETGDFGAYKGSPIGFACVTVARDVVEVVRR